MQTAWRKMLHYKVKNARNSRLFSIQAIASPRVLRGRSRRALLAADAIRNRALPEHPGERPYPKGKYSEVTPMSEKSITSTASCRLVMEKVVLLKQA
jgi:hypothetical protein